MEIQVSMLRSDMVKDAGDRPPDAGIETLPRIDVDRVANIFVAGMLHGLMLGKTLAIAMNAFASSLIKCEWVSICISIARSAARNERPVTTAARVSPAGAGRDVGRPLHHPHDRRFRRIRLIFPAPSRRWVIRPLSGTSPRWKWSISTVPSSMFSRRHHQPQGVTHAPGRRLAHAKDLGEPDRGQALVRLEQQPHGLQLDTQGQLGRMPRGMGRHGELEPASAIGALIKTRSRTPLAGIATSKRDRTLVPAGRTDSAFWPHHGFQQSPAMLFILEGHDHFFNGPNVAKRREHRSRPSHPLQITSRIAWEAITTSL